MPTPFSCSVNTNASIIVICRSRMAEVGVPLSVADPRLPLGTTNDVTRTRRNRTTTKNPRCHSMQPGAIALSLPMDRKDKPSPRGTNASSPPPVAFRLRMPPSSLPSAKRRDTLPARTFPSHLSKSSLSYPTMITDLRSLDSSIRHKYAQPSPANTRRISSARLYDHNSVPLHPLSTPLVSRPHSQYNHFVAYLRRQSLARTRRKLEQVENNVDPLDATITFYPGTPSALAQAATDLSLLGKHRARRPPASYHSPLRSSSLRHSAALPDESPGSFLPSIVSHTPHNSFVIDPLAATQRKRSSYELQITGDMLNYCYVSDSGVKYQGQLLSTTF